eukprot:CAMPEP_0179147852 /NCGR_PEP_ID=MMETSP0796-20121207/71502_1 /TAXON_ID=73915 /ORGANISM="Pyrodinium bahamense, Strain pbaha01" /LENGTH=149 /DNA_ID=CAMNT_0020848493 /DNA_START=305 /DNA_END=752 /DNA_ORIENTATION=+
MQGEEAPEQALPKTLKNLVLELPSALKVGAPSPVRLAGRDTTGLPKLSYWSSATRGSAESDLCFDLEGVMQFLAGKICSSTPFTCSSSSSSVGPRRAPPGEAAPSSGSEDWRRPRPGARAAAGESGAGMHLAPAAMRAHRLRNIFILSS